MTRKIIHRSIALAITVVLALASAAMSAPKRERADRSFTISGRVLKVDTNARQLLVADRSTEKLYLVNIPRGAYFKIAFGLYMRSVAPEIWQVRKDNLVEMRVKHTDQERLALLEDGRQAAVLTATR